MSITFHCDYCDKKIEASDNAGGKWGKCPSCHNKLYIPDLNTGEELTLAPIDEKAEEKKKQLMAETFKLEQDILSEREIPDEQTGNGSSRVSDVDDKELTELIISTLRQMADGNLKAAQQNIDKMSPFSVQALEILDAIALSEIPEPELSDLPSQTIAGLIRTLRSKIS